MWTLIVCDEINYVLKFDLTECKFLLSNFELLWSTAKKMTRDDLIQRFQEKNPQLDLSSTSEEDVIKQIDELVSGMKDETVTILAAEDNSLTLDLTVKVANLPITLNLSFKMEPDNNVFPEVLVPLIETVRYLEIREQKLFNLIDQSGNKDIRNKFSSFEANSKFKTESLFLQTFTTTCRKFVEIFTKKFRNPANVLMILEQITMKRKKVEI